MKRHLRLITLTPECGQMNFVIKLDATTAMIDRLLLVPRQKPWGIVPGEGDGTDNGGTEGEVTPSDTEL